MTTVNDVLRPGSTALLTTQGPDGPRTRPVIVHDDPAGEAGVLAVLTKPDTRKIADVAATPRATVCGTTADGYYALEARTEVIDDPAVVGPAMARFLGMDPAQAPAPEPGAAPAVAAIRLRFDSGKKWTVHSDKPFDNEVEDIEI